MTINREETLKEEMKFSSTKEWIEKQLLNTEKKCEEYEKKVATLKKSSRGTFSTELILAQNIQDFANKDLHKYSESKDNPYFARINFKEKIRDVESFYIGKFGLIDEVNNEEVVIDWRAPLANLYYSGTFGAASYTAPMGEIQGELLLKRKFQVKDGKIVNIFDEGVNELIVPVSEDGEELVDEFLKINLEENMSKKLKDVVNTIQREQNEIIRAYKNKPIIIQGSAGSGKTTVALHRLAYLVYTYGDEMNNRNILVVAPNQLFLDYISDILPNLGVSNVKQSTFEELCSAILNIKYKIITKDKKLAHIMECKDEEEIKYITASSKIKGTMTYKTIMDRFIKYLERKSSEVEDILVDEYILFSAKEIKRLYIKDLENLPINKRKDEINKYFKGKLKNRIEEIKEKIENIYFFKIKDIKDRKDISEEDKRKEIIKTYDERDELIGGLKTKGSKALKEFFGNWKKISVVDSYINLYNDEEAFSSVTDNCLPKKLADYMRDEINNNIATKNIDCDDLTALTYLQLKLEGVVGENYIHTVIDEAQDYSLMQFNVLKEISKNNSMTIVGDLGQGIYNYKGINSWESLIEKVFSEDATYITLSQSYRSTVEIIEFANRVLEKQKLNIKPALPILRHGDEPRVINAKEDEEIRVIDSLLEEIYSKNKKTVAIICKTYTECKELHKRLKKESKYKWELIEESQSKLDIDNLIIPSYMTKGLEFDATIVYNCDEDMYRNEVLDKKLLYVALTRALHLQYVMYKESLSSLLV
ncbi:ATPase AAA [Clostridium sulfidigenes]|uniref:ATPase AAA n=1 Tax=Clostridium sulfidigenes TaxID=318464 RepID=A0A084J8N8_9CLOT|nr:RNA polymerase recycling motor HelD [Clostridium sulfidigenes]KEZ85322.1 ATPase AAA [Clostridium sulfidigenes]